MVNPPFGTSNKLLLIEGDSTEAKLILEALVDPRASSFDVDWVRLLSDGSKLLGEGKTGLLLRDRNLPDSKGIATCKKLFESRDTFAVRQAQVQQDQNGIATFEKLFAAANSFSK